MIQISAGTMTRQTDHRSWPVLKLVLPRTASKLVLSSRILLLLKTSRSLFPIKLERYPSFKISERFKYANTLSRGSEQGQQLDDDEAAAAGERLNAVYERLQELGSATAEARAAKILHGLGACSLAARWPLSALGTCAASRYNLQQTC